MNRRHFVAAIGAAALAAVSVTPMMSDLIIRSSFHLQPPGSDLRNYRRNFEEMCRLVMQTGPLVLKGSVVMARRSGTLYQICHSIEPFLVDRSAFYGYRHHEVLKLPDEQLSELSGIPLASRTPVPAWAFRNS